MPLARKRTRLYAKGLVTLLEQRPRHTDAILNAFVAVLKENRHLRYSRSILEALTDVLEERNGTVRVKSESAFPLSPRSAHAIQRFLGHLPQTTEAKAVAGAAPGIHLTTARYHWDGRVNTMLKQLREHLTN